jgi:hypothetical protein
MSIRLALALPLALLVAGCAHAASSAAPPPSPADNGPLWTTDGGSVVPASGSVDANVPCQSMTIALQRDAAAPPAPAPQVVGHPVPCRKTSLYNGYLRSTLFIEGLDGNGARLFVATGFNPLHQDVEVPPPPPPPPSASSSPSPSGGTMSWQAIDTPAALVTTLIAAPFTPALTRLRWYDVDENFQPRLIGETKWAPPAP